MNTLKKVSKFLFFTKELITLNDISCISKWKKYNEIKAKFNRIIKNQNSSPELIQIALDGLNYLDLMLTHKFLSKNNIIDEWNRNPKINAELEVIERDSNSTKDSIEFTTLLKDFLKLKHKLELESDMLSSLPDNFELNNNKHVKDSLLQICIEPSSTPSQFYSAVLAANCSINSLLKVQGIILHSFENSSQQIRDFEIAFTPVSCKEYEDVRKWANFNGFDLPKGQAQSFRHPITGINWFDAVKWCNAKSLIEGLKPVYCIKDNPGYYQRGECGENNTHTIYCKTEANGYRLPTVEEWEWAAKGGRNSRGYVFAGSNTLNDVGWYLDNSKGTAHAVGEKVANELGLYDMSGNVWEWCWNLDGNYRRICGGSWHNSADKCAILNRSNGDPRERGDLFGFRLSRGV